MRTKNTELEQEIMALMLLKHAKHGLKTLMPDDFVAVSPNIKPPYFIRYLFTKVRACLSPTGDISVKPSVVKSSVMSDFDLSNAGKDKFTILIDRLLQTPQKCLDIAYFHNLCEQLKILTRSRHLVTCVTNMSTSIENNEVKNAEVHMRKYLEAVARFDYGMEEAKIIDYKDHFNQRLNTVLAGKKGEDVIPTGYPPLDESRGGLRRGELTMLAARTGGGKSVMKQDVSANIVENGFKVAYFSKEDSAEAVAFRLDARFTEVEYKKFRKSELSPSEVSHWKEIVDLVPDNRLKLVCMGKRFTVDEIKKIYFQMYNMGFEADVIVADYAGIMKPSFRRQGAKWEELEAVVLELKDLAIELNVPVLSSVQLKPEAAQNESVSDCDIQNCKQIMNHTNQMYAFINTDEMRGLGIGKIQNLKDRDGIETEFYQVEPNMNIIKINKHWKVGKLGNDENTKKNDAIGIGVPDK